MPFVALVIYFALQALTRPSADQPGGEAGTVEAAPSEATGSP
jgi:hypothetical protein